MAQFSGILGTQTSVTGATTLTIDDRIWKQSNNNMWDRAVFCVSVTTIGTQAFSCHVTGLFNGVVIPIAGLSGIGTTISTVMPVINQVTLGTNAGTTQSCLVGGVPFPRRIVFGNSATPGQTYSAVVSCLLYSTQ